MQCYTPLVCLCGGVGHVCECTCMCPLVCAEARGWCHCLPRELFTLCTEAGPSLNLRSGQHPLGSPVFVPGNLGLQECWDLNSSPPALTAGRYQPCQPLLNQDHSLFCDSEMTSMIFKFSDKPIGSEREWPEKGPRPCPVL